MMKSVFGASRVMIARRASNGAARRIGPTTKPMNRSMPVHMTPEMT